MKRDYSVYPSMIGGQSWIIWSYDTPAIRSPFDESHPLDVSAVWYVSPLWQFNDVAKTKYAFLGELNKQTAVSQQRIPSIDTNPEKTQTTITLQGERSERVQLAVYHPSLPSGIIECQISPGNAEGQLLISPSGLYCR